MRSRASTWLALIKEQSAAASMLISAAVASQQITSCFPQGLLASKMTDESINGMINFKLFPSDADRRESKKKKTIVRNVTRYFSITRPPTYPVTCLVVVCSFFFGNWWGKVRWGFQKRKEWKRHNFVSAAFNLHTLIPNVTSKSSVSQNLPTHTLRSPD